MGYIYIFYFYFYFFRSNNNDIQNQLEFFLFSLSINVQSILLEKKKINREEFLVFLLNKKWKIVLYLFVCCLSQRLSRNQIYNNLTWLFKLLILFVQIQLNYLTCSLFHRKRILKTNIKKIYSYFFYYFRNNKLSRLRFFFCFDFIVLFSL